MVLASAETIGWGKRHEGWRMGMKMFERVFDSILQSKLVHALRAG